MHCSPWCSGTSAYERRAGPLKPRSHRSAQHEGTPVRSVPDGDVIVAVDKLWTVFGSAEHPVVIHQDLDLRVRRGEIVSLVGGSGSGKTTLLRQILGLETPFRGQVCVLGEPASCMGGRALRAGSACCFSRVRCSRRSMCWTTSHLRCANSAPCPTR